MRLSKKFQLYAVAECISIFSEIGTEWAIITRQLKFYYRMPVILSSRYHYPRWSYCEHLGRRAQTEQKVFVSAFLKKIGSKLV